MTGRYPDTLMVLCLMAIAGCKPGDSGFSSQPAHEEVVLDSAHIRIVRHTLGDVAHGMSATWQLAPDLEWQVGASDSEASQSLYRVRGAVLLEGDRLAVGLGAEPEMRLYERPGKLVRTLGRRGSGPGEFRSLTGPWLLAHEQLAAYDIRQRRVTVFDTVGAVIRTTSVPAQAMDDPGVLVTRAFDAAIDGRVLAVAEQLQSDRPIGVSRGPILLVYIDTMGQARAVAGPFAGEEMYIGPPEHGGLTPIGSPPFARSTIAAVCADQVAVADNGTYEIRLLGPDGSIRSIIRADVTGDLITDDHLRAAVRERLPLGMRVTDAMIADVRQMTVNPHLPVLQRITCDSDGHLWVSEYVPPSGGVRRIASYRRDGTLRGVLLVPNDVELLSVRGWEVVLHRRREDGAEMLDVARLIPTRPY